MVGVIARELQVLVAEIDKKKGMNPSNCIYLMVKMRQFLELTGRYSAFPVLHLYTNLTIHLKISESPRGMDMLHRLAEAIQRLGNEKKKLNDRVCEILEFKDLRKELLSIFQELKVPTFLVDTKQIWEAFLGLLMRDMINKPLSLEKPVDTAKHERLTKRYNKVHSAAENLGVIPDTLRFRAHDGQSVEWEILVTKGSAKESLSGTVCFTEFDRDFARVTPK